MNIRKIIDREKWKTHLYDSDDRSSTNECHNDSLDRILIGVEKRIAELEAQTPKTVNPRMVTNHWKCKCGAVLYPGKQHPETKKQWVPKYCMDCGSKLNWEDARC